MTKTLTGSIKRATGLAVEKKSTTVYAKYSEASKQTDLMFRFGKAFYTQTASDVSLPVATYNVVTTLPGSSIVSKI
jgi:hypothetical protein